MAYRLARQLLIEYPRMWRGLARTYRTDVPTGVRVPPGKKTRATRETDDTIPAMTARPVMRAINAGTTGRKGRASGPRPQRERNRSAPPIAAQETIDDCQKMAVRVAASVGSLADSL